MSAAGSAAPGGLARRVRAAIAWRSGSQLAAQLVAWTATFLVIRLLDPADYGLFAMTQVVLVLLNLVNGYGVANALIRQETVERHELRQALGALLLLNGGLAAAQFLAAPLVADFYRQPIVADLLRVQSLLYFATPFLAVPYAVLSRRMDFRRQAQVRILASLAGAGTALGGALAGWGIWTLVAAPMALFYVEAIGMTIAARAWFAPSFDFRGAGTMLRYGGAMTLVQFFWFLQSQSDVFIAGRMLDPHALGIYTTALFLAQLLPAKFVPALNEVAFAAYSRIHAEQDVLRTAFLKAVRLVMLVAVPAYLGMAVTAAPLVETVLGAKWRETASIIPVLALAMPLLTLQILFAPATNARGMPAIAVQVAATGGIVLPLAFAAGIGGGIAGLAWAWVGGMAVLLAVTIARSAPAIGISAREIAAAVAPALLAGAAMAAVVTLAAGALPPLAAPVRLAALVATGAFAYGLVLRVFARRVLAETIDILRGREAIS